MEEQAINYKISTVIENFKKRGSFNNKAEVLNLIMSLKESLEFNTNIDWEKLCNELGHIYNDPSPIYLRNDYTPDLIDPDQMTSNDIFIFGSNTEGRHGAGAAKFAIDYFGAKYGKARGPQGRSYAIVTKDLSIGMRSIPLDKIQEEINLFLEYAHSRQDQTFWMTKIGCNLAGYTIGEIASMFANKVIPSNVVMPKEFVSILYWYNYLYSPSREVFYKLISNDVANIVDLKNFKFERITHKNVLQMLPKDIVLSSDDDYLEAAKHVVNILVKS